MASPSANRRSPSASNIPKQETPASDYQAPPAPPLKSYESNHRGAFNFLRHPDQPARIPAVPGSKSDGSATTQIITKSQGGLENTMLACSVDDFARSLHKNPFLVFEMWKSEYKGCMSMDDMKAMRDMVWVKEGVTVPKQKHDSINSVSPNASCDGQTSTATSALSLSKSTSKTKNKSQE